MHPVHHLTKQLVVQIGEEKLDKQRHIAAAYFASHMSGEW
jgi:hypothetical protein